MTPREFIGRCLNAANTALRRDAPGPLATDSFRVAGLAMAALPAPLSFSLGGYEFTVELLEMHEMMQFTAVMTDISSSNCWEATMILSKITGEIIDHWLNLEPECDDLVLFKVMTTNHLSRYNNN